MLPKTNLKTIYKVSKKLIRNPENIHFIYLLLYSTNSYSLQKNYKKLLSTKKGGEILYTSEELHEYFDSLESRPIGSVGFEVFSKFPNKQNWLVKASRGKASEWIESKHPYSWLSRRYRDVHDIWHILTGYEPDLVGEMCLSMFSYTQTKAIGWFILSILIFINRGFKSKDAKLLLEAYSIGKNTSFLLEENYNLLLSENLYHARKRLNIITPRYYQTILSDSRNNS